MSNRWSQRSWIWAGVALALFVALAGVAPEADPPTYLPGLFEHSTGEGRGLLPSRELLVEGPAKAHEARNYGLFGEFVRNPADTYQFWRIQAPVWVYPLAWTFRQFGVSYTTLRWFSVAVALIGLCGFLALGRRLLPSWATLLGLLLLGSNLYTSYFARSALIEVMIVSAAVWITVGLAQARQDPRWAAAAQVIFAAGFFAKQGMIYMFPLLVLCNVLAFRHWIRQGTFPRLRWLPVVSAVLLAAGSAWYITQPEYLDRVLWNYDHMLVEPRAQRPWTDRLDWVRFWWSGMVIVPGVGALGLPGALGLGVLSSRLRLSWAEWVVLAWFLSSWVAVFLASFWALRVATILVLPTYFIAAMIMARLWSSRPGRVVTLGVAGIALALNAYSQVQRLSALTYTIRDTQVAVRELIGDRPAVIVGTYAMPVLFATPYDIYYTKERFNTEFQNLQDLRVTHFFGQDEVGPLEKAGYRIGALPLQVYPVAGRELALRQVQHRLCVPANWWSNRTQTQRVIQDVARRTEERVRLSNDTFGFIAGTVRLPAERSWEIAFEVETDCQFSHPSEQVRIFINGILRGEFHNAPLCTRLEAVYPVSGSSFDYRFEFTSPSAVFHEHLVVAEALVFEVKDMPVRQGEHDQLEPAGSQDLR